MSLFINTGNKAPMSIDLIELSLKTTWAAFTDAVAKAEDAASALPCSRRTNWTASRTWSCPTSVA